MKWPGPGLDPLSTDFIQFFGFSFREGRERERESPGVKPNIWMKLLLRDPNLNEILTRGQASLALAQFKKTNPLYPGYLPEAPDPRYHGPGPEEDTFCNISKGNYKEKQMFLHGWWSGLGLAWTPWQKINPLYHEKHMFYLEKSSLARTNIHFH